MSGMSGACLGCPELCPGWGVYRVWPEQFLENFLDQSYIFRDGSSLCFAIPAEQLSGSFSSGCSHFVLVAMSSQRLFDSQVLDTDSALFDSQLDPGVWAGVHTLAAPVGAASVGMSASAQVSKCCGLKRKKASLDLELDFPDTFVEQLPPATIVNIPDDNSSMKQKTSERDQALQDKLAASELKVRELEAQLLVYQKKTDALQAEVVLGNERTSKLQARVQDYGVQLLEVMEEKNTLLAEKHARMISDLSMIRQAEVELS